MLMKAAFAARPVVIQQGAAALLRHDARVHRDGHEFAHCVVTANTVAADAAGSQLRHAVKRRFVGR